MHIGFIAAGAPFSFNNIIWINPAMEYLAKRVRLHPDAIRLQKEKGGFRECEHCRVRSFVEVHHVRPVWAFCASAILKSRPNSPMALWDAIGKISAGQWDSLIPDAHTNGIGLCHSCHVAETKIANRTWKSALSEEYPLVWSFRVQAMEAMAIMNRFYLEAA